MWLLLPRRQGEQPLVAGMLPPPSLPTSRSTEGGGGRRERGASCPAYSCLRLIHHGCLQTSDWELLLCVITKTCFLPPLALLLSGLEGSGNTTGVLPWPHGAGTGRHGIHQQPPMGLSDAGGDTKRLSSSPTQTEVGMALYETHPFLHQPKRPAQKTASRVLSEAQRVTGQDTFG